jgi:ubiquinone/menaquinone biosynthesis C-methylase UbiE
VTEERGLRFDRVADDYDRARPAYPPELLDEACAIGNLHSGARVLEVGCGTGKLTRALVDRGLVVDAVDPGARMVEVARRSLSDAAVSFHVGRFEDVVLPDRVFEAAFSATAFHWIDPAVGWEKVARLLRTRGLLALITHVPGASEVEHEFHAVWRDVVPEAADWQVRDWETVLGGAEDRRANVSDVWAWVTHHDLGRPEAASLFDDARITGVPVDDEETSEEVINLIRTSSSYLGLDLDRRGVLERRLTAVIERAGGTFRSRSHAVLVTARAT